MDIPSYLIGKKSGGSGGATIEVVTELPTTGESNVIYLVPKQDTGDNDVFDEYIYVNNDWELIGSTAIDLSGYQPLLTAGNNITIDANNVISASVPTYYINLEITNNYYDGGTTMVTDQTTFDKFSIILTDAYQKGYRFINLVVTKNSGEDAMVLTYSNSADGANIQDLQRKPTLIYWRALTSPSDFSSLYLSKLRQYKMAIGVSWNNNVATVSSVNINTRELTFLATNNSASYTPSNDYNPATKKYVDDTVAAAITTALGGSY